VQAHPKTAGEHLADQAKDHLRELLGDDPTPPRDAAEYQRLLFDDQDREPKVDEPNTESPSLHHQEPDDESPKDERESQ
jgi:hypothetical protein